MTGHVIHASTNIDARPETVWEVLTDVQHLPDVLASVKSARLLTEGEYAVGTRWREERTFFGHHGEEEIHVVESDPPRRTQQETRLGHDRIHTAYTMQVAHDGSTKLMVTATMDVRERNRGERLLWNTFGGHSFESTRRMLERDLEDVRREAESRSGRHVGGTHKAG